MRLPIKKNRMSQHLYVRKPFSFTIEKLHENGACFINQGATGSIIATLPPATIDQVYRFRNVTDQAIVLTPSSGESIRDISSALEYADYSYTMGSTGNEFLEVECLETGKWTVTRKFGDIAFVLPVITGVVIEDDEGTLKIEEITYSPEMQAEDPTFTYQWGKSIWDNSSGWGEWDNSSGWQESTLEYTPGSAGALDKYRLEITAATKCTGSAISNSIEIEGSD